VLLHLPEPPAEKLERSPLALVVFQIRYDAQPRLGTLETGLQVHEVLGGKGGRLPTIEQVQAGNLSIQFGPEASAGQSIQTVGWRMLSTNRKTAAAFHVDALTLETTDYGRWAGDFADLISDALRALAEAVGPVTEHRLGLRYVDRITDLDIATAADWSGWLNSWALGPAVIDGLSEATQATEMSSAFRIDDEAAARMRVAVFPETDAQVGVVDIDVFREGSRAFDVSGILDVVNRFHVVAKQLFFAALRPELYRYLKGETTDD